jgi:hypothetical protein
VEILVVLGIIGILAAILAGATVPMRQSARTISCMNNLRQISTALTAYYTDNLMFASRLDGSLPELLGSYIRDPKVFICPVDGGVVTDSYTHYYVPQIPGNPNAFLVGCANHTGSAMVPAAYAGGRAQTGKSCPVTWNGNPLAAGTEVTGGTLRFADGTTVTIQANLQVVVVVSFEEAQGRIYSAIRIDEGATGSVNVQAASGTHFDVATPACTAGVRGTRFRVTVAETASEYNTVVAVTEGVVAVDGGYPSSGQALLGAGRTRTFIRAKDYVAPTPGSLAITGPTISGSRATYSLTNVGGMDYTVGSLSVTWPVSSNKKLKSVSLAGTTVWSGTSNTSPFTLTLTGAPSSRTIAPGQTVQLRLTFSKTANPSASNYGLTVSQ